MAIVQLTYLGFCSNISRKGLKLPSTYQGNECRLEMTGHSLVEFIRHDVTTIAVSLGDICRAVYKLLPDLDCALAGSVDCRHISDPEGNGYGYFIEVEVHPSTFEGWVKQQFEEDFFQDYADDVLDMLSEWVQCDPPRSAAVFDLYADEVLAIIAGCGDFGKPFEGCLTGFKANLLEIALGSVAATIIDELEEADDDEYDDEEDYDEPEGEGEHSYNSLMALYYETIYPDTDLYSHDLID